MRPSGNPRDALGFPVISGSPLDQCQENCPTTNILHLNTREIISRRFFGSSTPSSCQSDSCFCINRALMPKLVCSVSLGFRCLAPEMCRLLTCLGGFHFSWLFATCGPFQIHKESCGGQVCQVCHRGSFWLESQRQCQTFDLITNPWLTRFFVVLARLDFPEVVLLTRVEQEIYEKKWAEINNCVDPQRLPSRKSRQENESAIL